MFVRIISTMIALMLGLYALVLAYSYHSHMEIQRAVNDKVTNLVESVSTKGMLVENLYDETEEYLQRLSLGGAGQRYVIQLKLEKQIGPNLFDVFFESSVDRDAGNHRMGQVVGRPLDVGDRVTVYVEDRSPTLFGKLIALPYMNFTMSMSEKHVRASKTAIVAKRFPDTVKGYDVIADLNTNPFNYIREIRVITKVNETGAVYNIPTALPGFKTYNISDPSDPNYIFPDGEFMRDEDIINGVRTVHYVQRY